MFPSLTLFRTSRRVPRFNIVYRACLCIVAQGQKRAFHAGRTYEYHALRYLVLALPLPLQAEVRRASPAEPFLSLVLEIDPRIVADLVLELGAAPPEELDERHSAIYVSGLSAALRDATVRFLESLHDPVDRRILAPSTMREMLYHVLVGEQGHLLRALAIRDTDAHRAAAAVRFLEANYAKAIDVGTVAAAVGVSPSTLHHTFKAVTSLSPIRYLKQLRLHEARNLMLNGRMGAAEAAFRVGYNSPSQFSREFRRLFGAPPTREVARLRAEQEATRTG